MSGDYIIETGDDGRSRIRFRGDEGEPHYYLAWAERRVDADFGRGIFLDKGIAGTWWTPIRRRAQIFTEDEAHEVIREFGDKSFYHHLRL